MYRPRVIPCLLLENEELIKTQQFSDPVYIGDAMNAVKIFNDAEADEIVFLDINATVSSSPFNFELISRIADEAYMPVAVGGGINSLEKVREAFKAGAEKVIINSAFHSNPELISEAAEVFGSQAIVVSIDVKKVGSEYLVYCNRGQEEVQRTLSECLKLAEEKGAGEIMLNHIDSDGMQNGYDEQLIRFVSSRLSIPLIMCGGAADYEDLRIAVDSGASAAAAGSLFVFMGGRNSIMINYPDREEMTEIFGKDE
ncbi:HisA/HisF-related TIM barrel protein [Salibacteraceae bacterium]|nr:HisA/HisF-related TIM barrel protein [Salibacteraceae bacterium]